MAVGTPFRTPVQTPFRGPLPGGPGVAQRARARTRAFGGALRPHSTKPGIER